jgi:hypothetical protein
MTETQTFWSFVAGVVLSVLVLLLVLWRVTR